MKLPEQLRALMRAARRQGWEIQYTGAGHWCWVSPAGERVLTPSTSASRRAYLNSRAALRRAGLKV